MFHIRTMEQFKVNKSLAVVGSNRNADCQLRAKQTFFVIQHEKKKKTSNKIMCSHIVG